MKSKEAKSKKSFGLKRPDVEYDYEIIEEVSVKVGKKIAITRQWLRDDIFQEARLACCINWEKSKIAGTNRKNYLAVCAFRAVDIMVKKWEPQRIAFIPASTYDQWVNTIDFISISPLIIAMFNEHIMKMPYGEIRYAPQMGKRLTEHERNLLYEMITLNPDWSNRRIAFEFQKLYERPLDKSTVKNFRINIFKMREILQAEKVKRPKIKELLTGDVILFINGLISRYPDLSMKAITVKYKAITNKFISESSVDKIKKGYRGYKS